MADTKRRRSKVIPFPEPEMEPEQKLTELVCTTLRIMGKLTENVDARLRLLETKVEALMVVADRPSGTQGVRP